ncbi:MAG TPA: 30S ribosomal protein S20 [Patescibacteria group bacterium]
MPISASAKKSLRVGQRRALENKAWKMRVKNTLKKTTAETLSVAFSVLDKAAKRHVIHANKADRLKARLAKRFSTAATETVAAPAKTAKK